jgi:hypothetical protein
VTLALRLEKTQTVKKAQILAACRMKSWANSGNDDVEIRAGHAKAQRSSVRSRPGPPNLSTS